MQMSKERFKVDTVDTVMDKLESMDPPLHILIVIGADEDLVERESWDDRFIIMGFLHGIVGGKSHTNRTRGKIGRRRASTAERVNSRRIS